MKIKDIRFGDVITYRNNRKNNVNKPYKYHQFYNSDFKNISLYSGFDIMKIQRYTKVLGIYLLKTIYRRIDDRANVLERKKWKRKNYKN